MSDANHDLLQDISDKVNQMYGALFGVGNNNGSGFVKETKNWLEDHKARIGRLERWAWTLGGAAAIVGWLIGHHLLYAAPK